jgi:hypothetical protein
MLRRMFGHERKYAKVAGERVNNEWLYSSVDIIVGIYSRRMKWVGECGMYGRDVKDTYTKF